MNEITQRNTENEEIRTIFQVIAEDIRRTKNQQWYISYYGILVLASIIGLHRYVTTFDSNFKASVNILLAFLSFVVAVVGQLLLIINQRDLKDYRDIINKTERCFSPKTQAMFIDSEPSNSCVDKLFAALFPSILWIGAILVIIVILYSPSSGLLMETLRIPSYGFIVLSTIVISISALLFTIYSFWWMNWRKGKVIVSGPRSFAVRGSEQDQLVMHIPLVFYNTGAAPIVINNLRITFKGVQEDEEPLAFNAVIDKIGTSEGRTFASQLPISGRQTMKLICEFQRRPGKLLFEVKTYLVILEGKLDQNVKWKPLCSFNLNITENMLSTINSQLITYDNDLW